VARRSQTQPSGLSRDRILSAALSIADREGVEALSMRRLAQELDVWPMSVYRYFQDKDALLDAMAADAAGTVASPPPRASWREQLHRLLSEAQRSIAASPGVAGRLPRAFLTPSGMRVPEAGIGILLDAGLSPASAASAWRALWSYTFGFATFRVESERVVRAAAAALPEDEYPALAAAGDELAAALADDESEFQRGLDRLLDGLELAEPAVRQRSGSARRA
jgi:AcrR family transcriptional regulator